MKRILRYLAAILAFSLSTSQATQTDTFGLHAVPLPGKVAIDGDLSDWDLSGEALMCYELETLQDIYSAHVSLMYDADNLYVAIRWKDKVPMGNIHDPRFQPDRGWAGDSVQLRFKTDRISHITAWYYAGGEEPAMLVDYGVGLKKPFGGGKKTLLKTEGWKLQDGAEMAFRKEADGKGYVQEIRIPWALVTESRTPGAGDRLQIGVELFWGEADWPLHRYADNMAPGASSREFFFMSPNNWGDVVLEPKGHLKLPEPEYRVAFRKAQAAEELQGPVEISYDLPRDARVTLAIDDKQGNRVRNLVPSRPRKAGKNAEKWDGLDDFGKPVEPGEYAFKAIYHDGIHANYALSFANPGNPSWETPDGRGAFYSDHMAPMAAAAGGEAVALAAAMGEAGKHLIGLNMEGKKLWGLANRTTFDGGWISLATDGKILWVASEGKESIIYRVEAANGKYAPWKAATRTAAGTEAPLLDLKISEEPGLQTREKPPANLRAIALHSGELAVCLYRENLVKILDAETGTVKASLAVTQPQSITHDGKSWLVLSEGRIQRLDADGRLSAFSQEAFPDAFGLASGPDGVVYLSVRGKDQNVKVFSPEGKLVREIGNRGGRPNHGVFDAGAMREPSGIAVDSRNRLWVTEKTTNPKRTSLWEAQTGRLLRDFSGTTSYAGAGSINPFDPSMAFADDTVYQLNWETGESRPVYSIGSSGHPDEIFPPSVHNLTSRALKLDGRLYVFTTDSGMGADTVEVTLFDGKNWRSVARLGKVQQGTHLKTDKARAAYSTRQWAKYQHPFFAGHDNESYAWADANGDGLVEQDELKFAAITVDGLPVATRSFFWGQLPGPDGTVTYRLINSPNGKVLSDRLLQYKITGFNRHGAPLYDIEHPTFVRLKEPIADGGQLIGGGDGRIYINQSPLRAIGADGRMIAYYPSWHVTVAGSHKAKAARPGYLIGPSSFLGVVPVGDEKNGDAGEVFYLNGNLGENNLFTYDCLYIQTLFKDTRGQFEIPDKAVRGMPMDNTTAGGESFGGNFIRTKDGKYYVTLGATDARVMEVTGLDSIKRLKGTFVYTKEQYEEAQKLAQAKAVEENKPKVYRVARATAPVELNGKGGEWPELTSKESHLMEIEDSPRKRYGRVQMRYDDTALYVAWQVMVPRAEMKNAGQDYRLLFKTGDVVDLMVGPEKQNADGSGNSRLVFSVMEGQPVVVLNQPKMKGAAKSESFEFASPWRSFIFDRVVRVPEVKMATGKSPGGYLVEAAIPWKVIGLTPRSGLKLRGDVGVLLGDVGGTQTIARHYWSNQNTNLVNDVPGEAELTPKLWGTLELE